jgi:MFS family permease
VDADDEATQADAPTLQDVAALPAANGWLNRNVIGMSLASLLNDACHEMATAALPGFLAVLRLPAATLGFLEGFSDALSSFVKLASGWYSDRLSERKPLATVGYLLSGVSLSLFALAVSWPLLLLGRALAWLGRGIRSPLRSALLAESVSQADRGKAFGLHRAGDTLGAIVGPLIAWWLLLLLAPVYVEQPGEPFRIVFLLTLLPGIGATVTFGLMVTERPRVPGQGKFMASVAALPTNFRRLLLAVGCFGSGDFAPSLLILAAVQILGRTAPLTAAATGALLYAAYNTMGATMAFPVGALSDRLGRRGLLASAYALAAAVMVGFAAMFLGGEESVALLVVLFLLAGLYRAMVDTLEDALAADLLPDKTIRGTGYGVLSSVNGVGDFLSSAVVGLLWAVNPALGFVYAAGMMALGAGALIFIPKPGERG